MTGIMFDYGWIEGRGGDRSVKCRIGMGSGNHTKRGMSLRMFATHQGLSPMLTPRVCSSKTPRNIMGFDRALVVDKVPSGKRNMVMRWCSATAANP
jgi:hypothetical protein